MRQDKAAALAAIRDKRYWREGDARQVLEAFEASELSLAAFCRRHELKDKRVRRWRALLGPGSAELTAMLPVRVVAGEARGERRAELQVVLRNGRRIAVTGEVDGARLTELAQVVEAWGC